MKLEGSRAVFRKKYSNIKFHKNSYSGTDGRTDGHEANSRFSKFGKKRLKMFILLSKLVSLMQTTHKLHTNYTKTTQKLHKNYTQTTHKLHTDYTQTTHKLHTNYTQTTHRLHTNYTHSRNDQNQWVNQENP